MSHIYNSKKHEIQRYEKQPSKEDIITFGDYIDSVITDLLDDKLLHHKGPVILEQQLGPEGEGDYVIVNATIECEQKEDHDDYFVGNINSVTLFESDEYYQEGYDRLLTVTHLLFSKKKLQLHKNYYLQSDEHKRTIEFFPSFSETGQAFLQIINNEEEILIGKALSKNYSIVTLGKLEELYAKIETIVDEYLDTEYDEEDEDDADEGYYD